MDEHVRAFFHRGARGLELGSVHSNASFVRMTFFNRCADDRPEALNRMIFVHDVPDLH